MTTAIKLKQQLGLAIEIAAKAHTSVIDRGGNPYILHPLWVMNQLLYDTELAIMGVLHDVVEDSDMTCEVLLSLGFSQRVVDGLTLLTHDPKDSYQEYIDKICTSIDAIRVKRKDLEHNSNITRLKGVSQKDIARMEKYHRAFIQLGQAKKQFQT